MATSKNGPQIGAQISSFKQSFEELKDKYPYVIWLLIISFIITIIIVLLILVLKFSNNNEVNSIISNVLTIIKSIIKALAGLLTISIALLTLSKNVFKLKIITDNKEFFDSALSFTLAALLFFAPLPTLASTVSVSIIENTENDNKKIEDELSFETQNDIEFVVDYNNVLFTTYELDQMKTNDNILIDNIIEELKKEDSTLNKGANYSKYVEATQYVKDFEEEYILICDNKLFLDNIEERIKKVDNCFQIRNDANDSYKDSENQRLMAARMCDKAHELYISGDKDGAIFAYKLAIFWDFTALNTYFNEDKPSAEREKIIKNIIFSYSQIGKLTNKNTQEHKRAVFFESLFSDNRNRIK